MTTPVFVSFWTPNYVAAGERLLASLKTHAPDWGVDVETLPHLGYWRRNVRQKPAFVLRKLKTWADRPVIWIDADAELVALPTALLDIKTDVAAVKWTWPDRPITEVTTNLVYFAPTEMGRRMALRWVNAMARDPYLSDQPVFNTELERSPDVSFTSLPVEYAFVTDIHGRFHPGARPVILQHQRSRSEDKSSI
ncbi:MAG: putative nucleotide-diphospho-sugar transferase [Egibacteraceae bacterium]